jgi:adenylate kinase family enzyme
MTEFYTISEENSNLFLNLDSANGPYTKDAMKMLCEITSMKEFYRAKAKINVDDLYDYSDTIMNKITSNDNYLYMIELVQFLTEHFEERRIAKHNMLASSKVCFDNLKEIFKINDKIVLNTDSKLVGGTITNTESYFDQQSMSKKFLITYQVIYSNGKEFFVGSKRTVIDFFVGVRDINSFDIKKPSDEDMELLTIRGKKIRDLGIGCQYKAYNGTMFIRSMYGPIYFNATGRIMIDPVGFKQFNPNYSNKESYGTMDMMPDDMVFMCWPYLNGFSFYSKRWGEIDVDLISDIVFDDNAFDTLVLDPKLKNLSRALVTNVEHGFKDIISGKSGGCIFLLHGPPGVGKTLTAEAISEHLHKPMYSVTVGECGVNPAELETKLARILEIANKWNAIVLIDEADIYMEERNTNDIVRNAMVGIFLRLLERYQGIMFLTTNRVANMDEAFRSRVSIIIEYKHFDLPTRTKVWSNLLKVAGFDMKEDHINILVSEYDINGRQIKNAIRLVQCIRHDKESKNIEQNSLIDDFKEVFQLI